MARINQGYYKEILKRYQDVECESQDLNLNYGLNLIYDIEVLWSCLERCNDLYNECNYLIGDLEVLIRSQKFEMEETETKYENMIESVKDIKCNTISNYKTYKSAFGSQFSDSEVHSINAFEINRE